MVARRDLHPGFIVTNLQGILDSIIYRLILEDFVFHALLGKRGGGGRGWPKWLCPFRTMISDSVR